MFAGKAKTAKAKKAVAQEYGLDWKYVPDAWGRDEFETKYFELS